MSQNNPTLDHESSVVHKHIDALQSIIERMAKNSASAKQWCVALVSAIFALAIKENQSAMAMLAFLPLILFGFLDTYYLHLEKAYVRKHVAFVGKLNDGELVPSDCFDFRPLLASGTGKWGLSRMDKALMTESLKSHSIYPFYGVMAILISLAAFMA